MQSLFLALSLLLLVSCSEDRGIYSVWAEGNTQSLIDFSTATQVTVDFSEGTKCKYTAAIEGDKHSGSVTLSDGVAIAGAVDCNVFHRPLKYNVDGIRLELCDYQCGQYYEYDTVLKKARL